MRVVNFNLILPNNKVLDLNNSGLIQARFNKYKSSEMLTNTNVLTDLEMSLFDKTGTDLLLKLQQETGSSKLRFNYGFDIELSDVYEMTITNIGTEYSQGSAIVTISGIGSQYGIRFPAEYYKEGTSIKSIIKKLADRNGWLLTDELDNPNLKTKFIDDIYDTIKLPEPLIKLNTQTDIQFITEKLKPILDATAVELYSQDRNLDFFIVSLQNIPTKSNTRQLALKVEKNDKRATTKRIWHFTYGFSPDSNIIRINQQINQSFLVDGLNLVIPAAEGEALISQLKDKYGNLYQSKYKERVDSIIYSKKDIISKWLKELNLPVLDIEQFQINYQFVDVDSLGNKTLEQIVLDQLQNALSIVNTLQITITGNNKIEGGDLIDLQVATRIKSTQGNRNTYIFKKNPYLSKRWRIIGITEDISVSGGYTTTLNLVSDVSSKDLMVRVS